MKTEELIDKLIAEGKLNREELDEMIRVEQAKNPVPQLQSDVVTLDEKNVDLNGQIIGLWETLIEMGVI